MNKKWNNKTEYYTYNLTLFSEKDIATFGLEIIKKVGESDGKPLRATTFLLRLKEKLEKVAQERERINQRLIK